jgi:hypothetical protein
MSSKEEVRAAAIRTTRKALEDLNSNTDDLVEGHGIEEDADDVAGNGALTLCGSCSG